jgi:hypothetical protein
MIGQQSRGPGERLRDPDGHAICIVTSNGERLP